MGVNLVGFKSALAAAWGGKFALVDCVFFCLGGVFDLR